MYFAASSSKPEVTQHRGFITTKGHFHNHKQIDAKKAACGDSNRRIIIRRNPIQCKMCTPRIVTHAVKSKIINFCLFFSIRMRRMVNGENDVGIPVYHPSIQVYIYCLSPETVGLFHTPAPGAGPTTSYRSSKLQFLEILTFERRMRSKLNQL